MNSARWNHFDRSKSCFEFILCSIKVLYPLALNKKSQQQIVVVDIALKSECFTQTTSVFGFGPNLETFVQLV